jgi:hypothetical protein
MPRLASGAFLSVIVVPALDHRFAWSHVSIAFVVMGEVLVAVGFLIVFRVFRENSFASAVIEVGDDHKVIDTGPYARIPPRACHDQRCNQRCNCRRAQTRCRQQASLPSGHARRA